jgi:hypothetical protein
MLKGKLNDNQEKRIKILGKKLESTIANSDYKAAKSITLEIQEILRPAGQETRLMKYKNWLYEAAIEAGENLAAIDGLKAIRLKTNKNTRVHLEAGLLLAIAFIRVNDLKKAEPYIKEVLKNDKVIKSESKRIEFREGAIERFREETILYSLKGLGKETLNIEEINTLAISESKNKSENQIFFQMGSYMPPEVKISMFNIDDFSKKQLPTADRLRLPSPQEQIQEDNLGKTLFSSLKRKLYMTICSSQGDVHKSLQKGLGVVLGEKYIVSAVIGMLAGLSIGIKALATSVVALILKLGLEIYCEQNKPRGIMELR